MRNFRLCKNKHTISFGFYILTQISTVNVTEGEEFEISEDRSMLIGVDLCLNHSNSNKSIIFKHSLDLARFQSFLRLSEQGEKLVITT